MVDEREGAKSIDYVSEEKGEKSKSKKKKPDIDGQSPDGRKEKGGGALREKEDFLLFIYKENPEDFLHEQLRVFFSSQL
ncbi:hypothetical protein ES288_A02G077200v1 [Gossypium darwinii]|uniref:Uncharacterized protein n=1 Tax=Gossypium darwinii TaxID=34276 RepID=A0A5D2HBB1_GOSDA|nr:hypothetical protein ES288_A02G077200v1 [Gossypium darwinii]